VVSKNTSEVVRYFAEKLDMVDAPPHARSSILETARIVSGAQRDLSSQWRV
jgi:hypothetical protein